MRRIEFEAQLNLKAQEVAALAAEKAAEKSAKVDQTLAKDNRKAMGAEAKEDKADPPAKPKKRSGTITTPQGKMYKINLSED